jgi:hypothetical protein
MYEEHPIFEKPADENAAIWRYMDFTKFVSLLDRQALFFARADTMPDPFEGSYSKENVRLRPELYKDLPKESLDKMLGSSAHFSREVRRFTLLNCWHISENESAAMWKLNLKTDEGVAIRSTFRRLADSLKTYTEQRVYIGKVKYIDYDTDWLPEGNIFYPFLHKRKSFEHERELRAVIQRLPFVEMGRVPDSRIDLTQATPDLGAYVPVDVDLLLETVFVSPAAPAWFYELVSSVAGKYGFSKEVRRSNLGEDPVY